MKRKRSKACKYFVGGNWKCNGTPESVKDLINVYNNAGDFPSSVEVVVAPTALHIPFTMDNCRKDIAVAAQNISSDSGYGAMTGELTGELYEAMGVTWTLTGHSERRRRQTTRQLGHNEHNVSVAVKTAHALKCNLKVIVCVGETLEDRESGQTLKVCEEQLNAVKEKISMSDWDSIVIAYEPVWAIGTGVSASPSQAQEVHQNLRRWLMTNLSAEIATNMRIIYGGSVKPSSAPDLIAEDDIDGFLVGGCSLKKDFIDIINACPAEFDTEQREKQGLESVAKIRAISASGSVEK